MSTHTRRVFCACFVIGVLGGAPNPASAQGRDSVLNGAVIGAAIGAGVGLAVTHATRDSDLTAGQYAYGALVMGGIGAGIGLGIDAVLHRSSRPGPARPRLLFAPAVGRVNGLTVKWRW